MKKLPTLVAIAIVSLIAISGCNKETTSPTEGAKYKTFSAEMRVLWSDHGLWTRNVIINIVDGAPGTTEAVNRLLKNQEDIGNAIKPYYGDAAGTSLTTLLKTHITTAADLITAANNGSTDAYDIARTSWYANGDSIALFLATANPGHWTLVEWKAMMKDHLDLTVAEVSARVSGDYTADVVAYDRVYAELMMMSDMLSQGIALQFPAQF